MKGVDFFTPGARLALELECLLMDTRNDAAQSRWWASAHEALEQWRQAVRAMEAAIDAAQQPVNDEVVFIDGVGAGRSSIKSCRDGVQWIRVGDRVYWPLSDSDAKRLHSACCGNGSFDGPATPTSEGEPMTDRYERLRAPFRWFGGKGNLLGKLLPLVPAGGRPYCEPYAGAASVFWSRDPAPVEVLNDLDDRIVNLFRVLQDREQFEELKHRILWTPYARAEFGLALDILRNGSDDPVERAWAFFVAQNQGFSGVASTIGRWGRTFVSSSGMAGTTNKWIMRQTMMDAWRWRLMHCQIDSRDALEVIRYWDNPEAVFYLDPPYHHDTRKSTTDYAVEQDHDHHVALVETILGCQGAVVLSGYDHPVYQPLVDAGWDVTRFETACDAAGRTRGSGLQGKDAAKAKVPRTEVVWRNPRAVEMTQ